MYKEQKQQMMQSEKKQEIQTNLTPAIFVPIDLEASLGTLRDDVKNDTKDNSNSSSMLKPYPISETDHEIRDRKRLDDESVDWCSTLAVNSPPSTSSGMEHTPLIENTDQQSMMEVTVDDFVLSAEEAGSLTDCDLDARTIQDDDFWETPVQVASSTPWIHPSDNITKMASVPFSVTFANQDPYIADIDGDNELTDAAPIRSVDMEW